MFMPDEAVNHSDGTWTIPDPTGGDWRIIPSGGGWYAYHPKDGWPENCLWSTPVEAAAAILGDPAPTRLADGRTYAEVYGR